MDTAAELLTGITAATGYTAAFDGNGYLRVTGPDTETNLAVTGSAAVLTELGLTATAHNATDLLTQGIARNDTLTINVGGAGAQTITFGIGGGEVTTIAELTTALSGLTGVSARPPPTATSPSPPATRPKLSSSAAARPAASGRATRRRARYSRAWRPFRPTRRTGFLEGTIAGGAITAHDSSGAPVNARFRWAKTDGIAAGGNDTWNLFHLTDGTATGTETAWLNVGQNHVFGPDGQRAGCGLTAGSDHLSWTDRPHQGHAWISRS